MIIMFVGLLWGKKAVFWDQGEAPTLKDVREAAMQEFPDIPRDQLDDQIIITADIYDDGRSSGASIVLLRKRP
ncbi:MAG: hypothetical protein A3I44_05960 [Candidatus Sungbacteria bacterium RIFCSPLOWO2_02_FULL_51_17]|nr:MAG: hypothetical protein A2676_01485 [Candidatus Sungbacteria bacterium RIFCSPHIGHO2_01_FULL_51_22]OHA06920.1 MAG: hypothetical protein A3B29_04855 [Candidatus Sungbacteria bacterium RIFCSPLOWO2_01_FULL_51_34]OHA12394.1 MAG: hypothetical protein A3I44_05960 [Candidatus Sungbacteria bacterium RIFCSPLOWO2_02_FULL_51_17]